MDGTALGDLARRAASHKCLFTGAGLEHAVAALGWEVVGQDGGRVVLHTGGRFEPAWAVYDGTDLIYLEATLVPPVEVDPYDYDAVEDVEVSMYDLFEEAAGSVEAVLGKPSFFDGRANPRFPDDEEFAVWLATWPTDTCRLSIKQLHEDQEAPYRLSFVVEPLG